MLSFNFLESPKSPELSEMTQISILIELEIFRIKPFQHFILSDLVLIEQTTFTVAIHRKLKNKFKYVFSYFLLFIRQYSYYPIQSTDNDKENVILIP